MGIIQSSQQLQRREEGRINMKNNSNKIKDISTLTRNLTLKDELIISICALERNKQLNPHNLKKLSENELTILLSILLLKL